MKTYLQLEHSHHEPLPPEFQHDDVRYPESLVRHFLQEYTRPGDFVFDPFAGFGTTLVAAQAMGRIGYGLELDPAKLRYASSRCSSRNTCSWVMPGAWRITTCRSFHFP